MATKTTKKQVVEVTIPKDFNFIEWADKINKLLKSKTYEVVFKDRPESEWAKDPLIPQTKEHFLEMIEHLRQFDDITCDVETNGVSLVDPNVKIVGYVLTTSEKSFYVPIRHQTNEPQLEPDYVNKILNKEVFQRKDTVLNFHNAKFDYNMLLKDGIDISWRFKEKAIVDTQIMMWMLDENQKDDDWYYILHEGKPAERTKYKKGLKGHAKKAKELGAVQLEGFSLKVLAPKFIGVPMTKFDDIMENIGFDKLPIHFAGKYARVDGIATHKLKEKFFHRIKEEKLEKAFWKVEMPFVRVIANMERRGMGINIPALERMKERAKKEQDELLEELHSHVGPIAFSTKQLSALFHDKLGLPVLAKTEKGNPQFNESALDKYEQYLKENKDKYDETSIRLPSIIIRIKKLEKILGTYIKNIEKYIDIDARIHTSLFQTGTVTGRLSSGNPNLQNLPTGPLFVDELPRDEWIQKRKELGDLEINKQEDFSVFFLDEEGEPLGMEEGWEEKCVKVEQHWLLRDLFSEKVFTKENREKYKDKFPRFGELDAFVKDGKLVTIDLTENEYVYEVSDYSQMELRMMAHLANDPNMIDAFKNNQDIHRRTASTVFGVDYDKVTGEQRQNSKAVNFGLIYGKTPFGFAQDWYSNEPDFLVESDWHPSGFEPSKKYLDKAQGFIDKYFEGFPSIKKYIESRQLMALTNGYVRTITGRKRRLPEVFSDNNSVRNRAKRQSVNTIVQGGSADYLKLSMLAMENWTDENADKVPFFQVLTVHDEVVALTTREAVPIIEPMMIEKMTQTIKLRCPIATDPSTVYTYGFAK